MMQMWLDRVTGLPARSMKSRLLAVALLLPASLAGQDTQVVHVARGNSAVVTHPSTLERVLITNPEIADAVPVSATEVVLNGNSPGTTTLLIWGLDGSRAQYQVRVTPDVFHLQEELDRLLPGQGIVARGVGNSILLSGTVRDERMASRALLLAESLGEGASIADHISLPDRPQVLLQVRFAEVNRNALQNLGVNIFRVDPSNPRGDDEAATNTGGMSGNFFGTGPDQSLSDQVNFYLFQRSANVAALIQALRGQGVFRSLAEPNLLAVPGETATFLAGGEFPFPVLQGAGQGVTIQFKEFGVRLAFTPTITNSGAIRLQVAPEVSSLDFGNGLQISGFLIPALLSRKAETVIELEEGQTFAIAGLMDNSMTSTVSKIPLLGDLPILGALFRSESVRQNRTELLVLVTPHLVRPSAVDPDIPPGEIQDWDWMRHMRTGPVGPGGAGGNR
jgi:pilus assembly protein CpaC